MSENILRPVHPGEYLREEFLVPLKMSASDLAERLGVSTDQVEQILAEKAPITPRIAASLFSVFGASAEMWMNMQRGYEAKIKACGGLIVE